MTINFKPPKLAINLFSRFRKWKLSSYKKKKVRQEKTKRDRTYYMKFSLNIDDPLNPQQIKKEFQMMVPAKAAFFAKIKAKRMVKQKINLQFSNCDLVTDEEFEDFENSKESYITKRELS